MMEIKVVCVCGQKYKFDVEPVNGQMPWPVRCPVCNADGTPAANVLISQRLAAAPQAIAAARPTAALPRPMSMPVAPQPVAIAAAPMAPAPVAIAAPPPPPVPSPAQAAAQIKAALRPLAGAGDADHDTWKWWYYILAGVCIAGFSIWQAYDQQRIKPLGELFLSALLIAIGFWQRGRRQARRQ